MYKCIHSDIDSYVHPYHVPTILDINCSSHVHKYHPQARERERERERFLNMYTHMHIRMYIYICRYTHIHTYDTIYMLQLRNNLKVQHAACCKGH